MNAMNTRGVVTIASTMLLVATVMAQVPFALDTTFRTEIESQYMNSILVRPDNMVIVSGQIKFPGDLSFRSGALLNIDGTRNINFANVAHMSGKLTPWMDRIYSGNGQIVRRQYLNGDLDPSFIQMNSGPYFSSLQGGDYHVYPDGRVLMSGAHSLSDTERGFVGLYNLIWFTNTGYLDTTRVHRKGNGVVSFFNELVDRGFICSSTCTQFDGEVVDWIFRVDSDGVPDTTFRTRVNWGYATTFLPLADGRVYAGGRFRRAPMPNDTLRLVRFRTDGSLDPGFTPPHFGLGTLPNNGLFGPSVLKVQAWPSGQLLVTGHFQYVNGEPRRGLCVVDSTGALTPLFDDCGAGPFTYQGLTNASLSGLVADADSTHYYIWGTYTSYSDAVTNDPLQRFVTRLHAGDITTGQAQAQGQEAGLHLYPNPSSGIVALALERVPKNAVLVVRDAFGREVQRHRITDHYTTLSLAESGVYLVEVWDATGRVAVERLLVE